MQALRENQPQLRPSALVTDARKATDAALGQPRSPAERIKADRSPNAPDLSEWQKERNKWLVEQFGSLPDSCLPPPEIEEEAEDPTEAMWRNQNTRLAAMCGSHKAAAALEQNARPKSSKPESPDEVLRRLNEEEEASKRRLAQLETRMLHVELGQSKESKQMQALPVVAAPTHGRRASSREQQDEYNRFVQMQQQTGVHVERSDPHHYHEGTGRMEGRLEGHGFHPSRQNMPGHGLSDHRDNPLTWGSGGYRRTDGTVRTDTSSDIGGHSGSRPGSQASRANQGAQDTSMSLRAKVAPKNANSGGNWMWG